MFTKLLAVAFILAFTLFEYDEDDDRAGFLVLLSPVRK
jgi:hypothetical protein